MRFYSALVPLLILHLDFNSIQMQKDAVVEHLRTAAAAGYNAVLWEIEDKVKWDTCPECVHPEAFSKLEFRTILSEAERLGLEPIPLFQTFAHAEYVLRQKRYSAWREKSENPTLYCVSKPEVTEFQKRFLREYLDLFGGRVRMLHLGGDEAHGFGTCPVCEKHDKVELYIEHLDAVAGVLRERGIRPCIWCDMILSGSMDAEQLKKHVARFPKDVLVWYWDYYYGCNGDNPSLWANRLDSLMAQGFEVVMAPSTASCGDGPFLPQYKKHSDNVAASADLARTRGLRGLCVTSWSVHLSPKMLQYPMWELAAKRYLSPGMSKEKDFEEIVARRIGQVSVSALQNLTGWMSSLAPFDSRFGIFAAKWSTPQPPGYVIDLVRKELAKRENALPNVIEVVALRQKIEVALGEIGSCEGTAALELLKSGARLTIDHCKAIESVLSDAPVKDIPETETERYYSREQTPYSAKMSCRLAWEALRTPDVRSGR